MRLPILTLSSLAVLLSVAPAAAEEELLRGPHPFIKDNELALHAGYARSLGDIVSGVRMQADFSHRLGQVVWFDVQMGVISGSCHTDDLTCSRGSGNGVDILAGAAWKFQTRIPLVIHTRVDGGPVFLFPYSTQSAAGFMLRGGAGAHYYLYDWFGLGGELGGGYGVVFFHTTPKHSGSLGTIQATVGVTLQF